VGGCSILKNVAAEKNHQTAQNTAIRFGSIIQAISEMYPFSVWWHIV
jgi:hypothetical protein